MTGFSTDADDDWLRTFQDVLIRRAWLNEGFQKAEVKATQRPLLRDAAGQHVEVTITVDEGMQYRLGEVTFRTSDPTRPLIFSEEKLRKTIPLNEGDLFDTSKVRESIEALKVLYGSHGYIDFVTTPITDIDNETQRINLTMELDQQQQFRIRDVVVFTSNPKVRDAINAKLQLGDIVDVRIMRGMLKGSATSLPPGISDEDIRLTRDVRTSTADVQLNLERCPVGHN